MSGHPDHPGLHGGAALNESTLEKEFYIFKGEQQKGLRIKGLKN